MKKELPHFYIGESLGGQQAWYSRVTDFGMHIGGCAAITACDCAIYLQKYFGLRGLYPFDVERITREDYLRFGKIMEPYLYPRWSGVDKLEIYLDGFGKFLSERGVTSVKMSAWHGEKNLSASREVVRKQIDAGWPLPCLTLKHKEPSMQDYYWHWFILNGYDEHDENFSVKAVSYGVGVWLNFATLWDTGYDERGGLILLDTKTEAN